MPPADKWPFPGESSLVRARRVGWALLTALTEENPAKAAELVQRFAREWGEDWLSPVDHFGPDDYVTSEQAGQLIGVSAGRVSYFRRKGLLPGTYVKEHKRYYFQVRDVQKMAEEVRSRRTGKVTDTLIDNGRSVSA